MNDDRVNPNEDRPGVQPAASTPVEGAQGKPAPALPAPGSTLEGTAWSERYDQSWQVSLLRPALIVILVVCVNVVLIAVITRFATGLGPSFSRALMLLATAAALIGAISTTVLAQPALRLSRTAGLRLAELGLLLVLTRVMVWATATGFPTLDQLLRRPASMFLDLLYVAGAAVVAFAWVTASEVTHDLNQLGLGSDELYVAEMRSDRSGDPMRSSGIDRRAILTAFATRWVSLGLLLILLSATLRQGAESATGFFALMRQEIEPLVMTALIVYFLAGLLLLSHGQLAQLRARWALDRLPTDATVTNRWPPLVTALIGAVALFALLLPFGGTFLLSTVLGTMMSATMAVLLTIYQLLLRGLIWLLSLFGAETPPALLPPAQAPAEVGTAPPPLLQVELPPWLGGALFYGLLALFLLYGLSLWLGDRQVRLGWLNWLLAALRKRWAEWREGVRRLHERRRARAAEQSAGARRGWMGWRLPRREDPDAQVRALYLEALRHAAEVGIPRAQAETPLHFAPRLEKSLEGELEEADVVRSLTDAFVQVRYAGKHAAADQVQQLRVKWQALTRALRRHQQPADAPGSGGAEESAAEESATEGGDAGDGSVADGDAGAGN